MRLLFAFAMLGLGAFGFSGHIEYRYELEMIWTPTATPLEVAEFFAEKVTPGDSKTQAQNVKELTRRNALAGKNQLLVGSVRVLDGGKSGKFVVIPTPMVPEGGPVLQPMFEGLDEGGFIQAPLSDDPDVARVAAVRPANAAESVMPVGLQRALLDQVWEGGSTRDGDTVEIHQDGVLTMRSERITNGFIAKDRHGKVIETTQVSGTPGKPGYEVATTRNGQVWLLRLESVEKRESEAGEVLPKQVTMVHDWRLGMDKSAASYPWKGEIPPIEELHARQRQIPVGALALVGVALLGIAGWKIRK